MASLFAAIATVVFVLAVQTARWLFASRREGSTTRWVDYMQSLQVWVGWPLVLVIGSYMFFILLLAALLG